MAFIGVRNSSTEGREKLVLDEALPFRGRVSFANGSRVLRVLYLFQIRRKSAPSNCSLPPCECDGSAPSLGPIRQ